MMYRASIRTSRSCPLYQDLKSLELSQQWVAECTVCGRGIMCANPHSKFAYLPGSMGFKSCKLQTYTVSHSEVDLYCGHLKMIMYPVAGVCCDSGRRFR